VLPVPWGCISQEEIHATIEIISLIKQCEVLYNKKVCQLRSDRGIEFQNSTLEEFCEEKVIAQNFSAPQTPQQNRVAERSNRTLIEARPTMVVHTGLPLSLWVEAVNTTYYTENISIQSKTWKNTV